MLPIASLFDRPAFEDRSDEHTPIALADPAREGSHGVLLTYLREARDEGDPGEGCVELTTLRPSGRLVGAVLIGAPTARLDAALWTERLRAARRVIGAPCLALPEPPAPRPHSDWTRPIEARDLAAPLAAGRVGDADLVVWSDAVPDRLIEVGPALFLAAGGALIGVGRRVTGL